jgi:hypothetical protein
VAEQPGVGLLEVAAVDLELPGRQAAAASAGNASAYASRNEFDM